MYYISRIILWMLGWRIRGVMPGDIHKSVIIMAPHTSNMDFFIGRLGFWVLRIKPRLIIKKEMFFFPVGNFLRALGGVPIDRHNSRNVVKYITGLFKKRDNFHVLITPEGTRDKTHTWKRGFYFIARKAQVPIALGYLDYEKKIGGVGGIMYPSGDFEEDFKKIEDFYRDKRARYPKDFNLSQ